MRINTHRVQLSQFDKLRDIKLPKKLNKKLSELCGIHIADGHMRYKPNERHYLIRWGGDPRSEKEYYDNYITKLWLEVFNAKIKPKLQHNGMYGFEFYSKGIFNFLNKCVGIPAGNKVKTVSIPKIFKSTCKNKVSKEMMMFLKGVIDNDFYLIRDESTLELGGWFASKNLVEDLYTCFNKLGLHPKIRSDTRYFDKRLGKWIVRYCIRIRRKEDIVKKWFKLIGTSNLKISNRYNKWRLGY